MKYALLNGRTAETFSLGFDVVGQIAASSDAIAGGAAVNHAEGDEWRDATTRS